MDAYGVVEVGGGSLSVVGLILYALILLVVGFLSYGFAQEYKKGARVPVFLLMFSAITTLFTIFLAHMGWWIYAT